ncbi:asparagine synthase-related protein [Bacillus sp. FJAT-45037]|uniref:asparagine synthase-related protein n=1 Tax=Bacillus sp. FJAT-45037 TaxID=2011007 RepID=UPI000C23BDD4|nr:asparagine synthetase B family protein [Bacillus sp. FJAT-45037]
MNVQLKQEKGFSWKRKGALSFKGYLNADFDTVQFATSIASRSTEELKKALSKNQQFFALLVETEDKLVAAVDHLRSFPLFYAKIGTGLLVSDDARWIQQQVNESSLEKTAQAELAMTGYVTGSETLLPSVKQLQAGEYLFYDKAKNELNITTYLIMEETDQIEGDYVKLINRVDQLHEEVFRRMIDSLQGRTIILPLSGGYDSRIIAMMLKRLGYEKVICYTYGKPGNWEANVSKDIAESLDYEWIFVPYSAERWQKWYQSQSRSHYYDEAGDFSALPHIQDIIAVEYLNKEELIPADSVFIPGHTAFLSFAGYERSCRDLSEVADELMKKHYVLWDWSYNGRSSYKNKLKEKVVHQLNSLQQERLENAFYLWEVRERHAKFICNSVRAYEHFGYEWRMPLWEKEMLTFWIGVPQEYRYKKRLYKDYFTHTFLKDYASIEKPNSHEKEVSKGIRDLLKSSPFIFYSMKKAQRIKGYQQHPFDWFKLVNRSTYVYGVIRGAKNINSFLVNDYLDELEKGMK